MTLTEKKLVWWESVTPYVDGQPLSKQKAERLFWFVRGVEPIDHLARQVVRPEDHDVARRLQEKQDTETRKVSTAFLVTVASMVGGLPNVEFRVRTDPVPLEQIDAFNIGQTIRGPYNPDGWYGIPPTLR